MVGHATSGSMMSPERPVANTGTEQLGPLSCSSLPALSSKMLSHSASAGAGTIQTRVALPSELHRPQHLKWHGASREQDQLSLLQQ